MLVDFKALKKVFFITEHYNPMQKMVDELASQSCQCYNVIRPGSEKDPGARWF